jgi:hypothetical protein
VLRVGSTFEKKKQYAISVAFTSKHNGEMWKMSVVYGPCTKPARTIFIDWMKSLDIKDDDNWILLGDFNFYRSLEDKNMPGVIYKTRFVQ